MTTVVDLPVDRIVEVARRYRLKELAVFGSVARGEATPDSDVDFLYVRSPDGPRGMDFLGLQEDLEQAIGRKVDVVPKDYLHWVIRDRVLAEAEVLYAA